MHISELFIKKPVMTFLTMFSFFLFGLLAYFHLPVSDLPNIDLPTIQVTVSYPGANPETMANAIATPLEQQFMTMEGIETIFSTSSTGNSTLLLTFALDRNLDAASTDVQAAISRAQPNLPSNLPNQPVYEKVNPSTTPILYFVLTSPNMTLGTLYDYGKSFLGQRLSMIEGVAQVKAYGSPYAVRVQLDPEKLAAKGIGFDEVVLKIQQANVDLPLGTLYGKKEDYTIDATGQLFNANEYNEVIIKSYDQEVVKIKDIGNAIDSVQNDKFFQHYVTPKKDQECVVLAIQRLPGMNTVKIASKIRKEIENLKKQLPENLTIEKIYDKSDAIQESIDEVNLTLITALVLVIAIIFCLLGKAINTLIPSLSLPLSIFGTFAIIYFIGFSLDILSLLAITLSIGFLVDDAIVVLENHVRHLEMGKSRKEAAIESAKEIATTVISMTLCLIAAFIPMIFMQGVIGRLFRECAITIIIAVFISAIISLTLTPTLGCYLISSYQKEKKGLEKLSFEWNEKLKSIYEPILFWAIYHPKTILSLALFTTLASIFFYQSIPKDLLPPDDVGFIQGFTQARDGTSPFLMQNYHQKITEIAIKNPDIESIISISSSDNTNQGVLFFRLKPFHERKKIDEVMKDLSKEYHHLTGVNVYLSPLPLIDLTIGTTSQALYQYCLTSIDQKALFEEGQKMTQKMRKNPLFSSVSSDLLIHQPKLYFEILRDKASTYQVTAEAIEKYLGWAYSNNKISLINGKLNQYDVIVETYPQFYQDPSVLSKLYVYSEQNEQVPLREIIKAKESVGPLTINHINGISAVNISFNPGPQEPLGPLLEKLNSFSKELPPQVAGTIIGTAKIFEESFQSLTLLFIISFFVIYVILGILYESLLHPITVMSSLPPTLFGGLLTLYLFHQTLSIYSFVGLILLMGIVLKNGIMMVDFANDFLENQQKDPKEAIVRASLVRFRPILMTTMSALMGALPIAFGIGGAMAQNRISLGLSIVGGLIFSQMITLLVTPVLYLCLERLKLKVIHFLTKRS